LKVHPDRVPAESPERATRTRKFQLVNDAYYTLSDASRRRDYDAQRRMYGGSSTSTSSDPFADASAPGDTAPPGADGQQQGAYSWAWNFFTKGSGEKGRAEAESAQFGDVFEEMLREEGMAEPGSGRPTSKFWSVVGGISGGALGFIVANMPGALAGAVAGNRLGAVRDTKGKSVYAVFQVSASVDVDLGRGRR
jgi:curved DNA-binding protein CbpA